MATPQKRNKPVTLTSPIGVVRYAWVDKPQKKYKKEDEFEYSVTMVLDPETGSEFSKRLEGLAKTARDRFVKEAAAETDPKKKKKMVGRDKYELTYGLSKDEDDQGEETGAFVLKAKRDSVWKTKEGAVNAVTIPVFDAKLAPAKGLKLGKGSKVRISFRVNEYVMDETKKVGVSLRLAGVQVLELVEYGGDSAANLGFSAEDGFEAGPEADTESAPFSAAADGEGDTGSGDY